MNRTKPCLLFLALLLPACQTAGPKTPPATAAPLPEPLRPYAGALRILVGKADLKALTLKPGDSLAGACDLAVRVRSVALEKGNARFALETVGEPRVGERRPTCKQLQPGMPLVLTSFAEPVTPAETARIDAALLTPEDYLHRKGTAFDRPKGDAPSEIASQLPDASDSERRLARSVVAWPRPLLSVEALYHDASGRGRRHERLVALEVVVGGDGRVYRHMAKAAIDREHEAVVEAALQLWRFEPARRADGPIGARVPIELALRVY